MATAYPAQSIFPDSYVGFDSITKQIEKKSVKRGFQFNVICVGKLEHLLHFSLQLLTRTRPDRSRQIDSHQHHLRLGLDDQQGSLPTRRGAS